MPDSPDVVTLNYKGARKGSITFSLSSSVGDLRKAIAGQADPVAVQLIAGGRKLQVSHAGLRDKEASFEAHQV